MVVQKECEPELSYILPELFNVSEGILFLRLLEGLICGPVFKNVGIEMYG